MAKDVLKQIHFYLIIFFVCHGLSITVMTVLSGDAGKMYNLSVALSFVLSALIFAYDMFKMFQKNIKPDTSDIIDDVFLIDKQMKRETIKFKDKQVLADIVRGYSNDEYELMQDEISNIDPEDGGGNHDVVIKRKSDDKYFAVHYSDWDMEDVNIERDFPDSATEVFARKVEILVFE